MKGFKLTLDYSTINSKGILYIHYMDTNLYKNPSGSFKLQSQAGFPSHLHTVIHALPISLVISLSLSCTNCFISLFRYAISVSHNVVQNKRAECSLVWQMNYSSCQQKMFDFFLYIVYNSYRDFSSLVLCSSPVKSSEDV